jgi:hypothetical protein
METFDPSAMNTFRPFHFHWSAVKDLIGMSREEMLARGNRMLGPATSYPPSDNGRYVIL